MKCSIAIATSLFACAASWAGPVSANSAMKMQDTSSAASSAALNAEGRQSLALFQKIKSLTGEWQAPLDGNGSMVNIFRPFAYGTKVLAEEWENGRHITSTVFYVVGNELHADHFCDYKNEPRYRLEAAPNDANVIDFKFVSATNLDKYPVHFHSTTWHFVDDKHLIQDWYTAGDKQPVAPIRMSFTRIKLSVREDGSPTAFSEQQVKEGSLGG
ncbi:hypothetical protein [Dyella mobilis]|uniref:DUF1579 domain-containing protein n=1 Tax=Dyella mobilis TaxID=1849582 RepID=A0ABS2KEN0_9GAMM|nr:hypothetical protein [Dyella mobilis]MBM7129633.1 hypothetical protein [Dyella mobilis]GLQ98101.1 hypothetical protein GCM10007863_25210 [Dyella mobilis]